MRDELACPHLPNPHLSLRTATHDEPLVIAEDQRGHTVAVGVVNYPQHLSGGRVDFGVGIGRLKEEFENLGMDFAGRGPRTEEYLLAMKALWSDGISEFSGQTVTLQPCHFNPKPRQRPHPPIIFGGESDAAMGRVARLGDGWYGYDLTPEDLLRRLTSLDAALASTGRKRAEIQIVVGPNRHPVTEQTLGEYAAAGADQLVVPMFASNMVKLEQRLDALLSLQPAA